MSKSSAAPSALSVIMPIRGSGYYLPEALRSLARQAHPVAELLVVDDGMQKAVYEALQAHLPPSTTLRILPGAGIGPSAARNVALKEAQSDLIGFLDDDDLWPECKLGRQIGYLARHPEIDVVGGRIRWFSKWDEASGAPVVAADDPNILHVNLGAFVYRRAVFDRLGPFDESQLFAEDVDFLLRIVDHNVPLALLDHTTLEYRRHASGMTALASVREKSDFQRALFRSLRRRRDCGLQHGLRRLENFLVSEEQ